MPFKSEKQRKWLWANKPEIALKLDEQIPESNPVSEIKEEEEVKPIEEVVEEEIQENR